MKNKQPLYYNNAKIELSYEQQTVNWANAIWKFEDTEDFRSRKMENKILNVDE